MRLAGAVPVEQHDEWEAGDRRYYSAASIAELETMDNLDKEPAGMPEISAAQPETTDPLDVEKLHHSARRRPNTR